MNNPLSESLIERKSINKFSCLSVTHNQALIYFSLLKKDFMPMLIEIHKKLIPIALSDFGLDIGNIVNASLLSHLPPDEDSAAAAAIIFTTQVATVVIPSAFLYVITPVMFYAMPEHKGSVVTASMFFGATLGVIGFLPLFLIDKIFFQLGVPAPICDIIGDYFFIFSCALPLWMIATALNKTAIPLGHENTMYLESLINFICITGFSSVFVDVYPLPYFSPVQTIALSYPICALARIGLYSLVYSRAGEFEQWNTIDASRCLSAIRHLLSMGWKLCVQLLCELGTLFLLPILAAGLLKNIEMNLAVLNVMIQCFSFSIIITLAMAVTAINIVGDLCKNEHYQFVRPYINTLLAMSTLYNVVLYTIVMAKSDAIINFFMKPEDNVNTGLSGDFRVMFTIMFFGLVFNAYKDIINMAQRSMKLHNLPMKVSVTSVVISIALAAFFATYTNLGVGGIWLGYNIGNMASGLFLLCHWHLVSQPEKVKEIFSEGSNKAAEFDQLLYCFKHCKEVFFQPIITEESTVLSPVV